MNGNSFDLGELFIIGFHESSVTPEFADRLNEFSFGGVILFSRNLTSLEQWAQLTGDLQALRRAQGKSPLFIAVDEEGGTVSRMPDETLTFPGARALAHTGDPMLIAECGTTTGSLLNHLGVTTNFAPVLDVNTNPQNPGIGIRSFGTSAQDVTLFGIPFLQGLMQAGIMPCAKHFPGKGEISKDSHIALPVCRCTEREMESLHLPPFKAAIDTGVQWIMTSHAVYPCFGDSSLPGTLSKAVLTGLLREKLRYTGLIVTDDLEMGALRECGSTGETAYRAISAGCDIALICHDAQKQNEAYNFLRKKVQEDNTFRARCKEAYDRIMAVKKSITPNRLPAPYDMHALNKKIADKAVQVIKNEKNVITNLKNKKMLVAGAPFRSKLEVEINTKKLYDISDFALFIKEHLADVDTLFWDIDPSGDQIQTASRYPFEKYDVVLVFTNNAHLFPHQKQLVDIILTHAADKTVLVPVKNPEDSLIFPQAHTIITTLGYNKTNIQAFAEKLIS